MLVDITNEDSQKLAQICQFYLVKMAEDVTRLQKLLIEPFEEKHGEEGSQEHKEEEASPTA